MHKIAVFFRDRMQVNALLIVLCFVSVLLLRTQSGASYATYLLAVAMLLTINQWNDVFSVRLMWGTVLLLLYLAVTSFWSNPFVGREALSVFSRALLVFFFVVAFAECQLRGQLQRWLGRAMAVVGSIATLAAIIVFFVTDPADGRLNGLGQLDTHVIAALVYGVVLIFVLDTLVRDQSRRWKSFAVISAILITCAVLLSDSRNAWVSVLIGVGVFMLAHSTRDKQRFIAGIAAMSVVFGVLLAGLLANDVSREILLPRGDSFRPIIWSSVVNEVIQHRPLFGLGILTDNDVRAGGNTFIHPHSMYLSVFFQGGVVGLVLFCVVITSTLRVLMRHYDSTDAKLALGVLGITLPAYLLDGHELIDKVGATWLLFWLPVAISLGFRWSQPAR
ncbi:MAG: O-antigen ligase family protein [Gammaproteobacteria bacterium]|nr:O-antigen ligase family protein [Gammaproteobacteria bacterium]